LGSCEAWRGAPVRHCMVSCGSSEFAARTRRGLSLFAGLFVCYLAAAQPVKRAFRYSTNVGVAAQQADATCLAINNTSLPAGEPITLIVSGATQSVVMARVLEPSRDACASMAKEVATSGLYKIEILDKGMPSLVAPAIAVLRPAHRLVSVGPVVAGDIDGDGKREFFRACASSEGLHLTVWSGRPLHGRRRWHIYQYLGYDLEANCTAADLPNP
jgi:hypothetical protein